MRIKKYFYFDEERVAEDIIKNGFENNKIDYGKMYILSRYFYHILGYRNNDLQNELITFCKKYEPTFNPIINYSTINKWVTSAEKYNLRKVESVVITERELSNLSLIENIRERKVMFIILVLAKARKQGNTRVGKEDFKESDNFYIKYDNFTDVIRLANIPSLTINKICEILHKHLNMITLYSPEKELIKLEYADPSKNGFTIYDLENVSDAYEVFFGENLAKCENCGRAYSKNSNRQRYCSNCKNIVKKNKDKEFKRKERGVEYE